MKLSDRLDKLHDDKLLSVLESFLERDREEEILNVLPHLRQQRPHFNQQFDAIQRKAQEALSLNTVVKDFEPVRIERCQNCGYAMRQYSPQSVAMTCESCDTVSGDANPPEFMMKSRNPLFALHKTLTYQGALWQVIGWQSYAGTVKEWDGEDKVWETNPWRYESWWVMNQERELAWITQDKEGYSWSRKIQVEGGIPKVTKSHEVGRWTLRGFHGEFSYFPKIGERVDSYERGYKSVEVLLADNNEAKEIEAFSSRRISSREMLLAFDQKDKLQKIDRARSAMMAIAISIALLLGGFWGLKTFEREVLSSDPIEIDNQLLQRDKQVGSFSLEKESVVDFALTMRGTRDKGSFSADYIVKDSDNQVVTEIPMLLWFDHGTDGDGAWSESMFTSSQKIKIPASKYYQLWISPDDFTNWSSVTVTARMTKNKPSFTPIIFALVPLGFLFFIIFLMQSSALKKESGASI